MKRKQRRNKGTKESDMKKDANQRRKEKNRIIIGRDEYK